MTPPRTRLSHDQRLVLLALGAVAPGALIALVLLWTGNHHPRTQWTLTVAMLILVAGFLASLRARVIMPLQTVANLLAAMREDDFSIRGRTADPEDPLGAVLIEINALANTLHEQRLGAVEATALLRTVMEQALGYVGSVGGHLHVSFDVDFLDPGIAPGVPSTVPGGPTYREAQLCMEMIHDSGLMRSLEVMELNPAFDEGNRTAELCVELVESLFGEEILARASGVPGKYSL